MQIREEYFIMMNMIRNWVMCYDISFIYTLLVSAKVSQHIIYIYLLLFNDNVLWYIIVKWWCYNIFLEKCDSFP